MKILALSDIHGDKLFMRRMAERGHEENVDLVIIAGDLVSHDGDLNGLIGPLKEKGLEVAIIPGNHEGLVEVDFLVKKYGLTNLHNTNLQIGDLGIFGCGFADIGTHTISSDDLFSNLFNSHSYLTDIKKTLMVTHVQPSNSLISLVYPGCSGVRRAIEMFKPDVHICGHIHETHGIEEMIGSTRVINVGKSGRIIEF